MSPEEATKIPPHCGVEGHGPAHRFAAIDCYACMECDVWLDEERPPRPSASDPVSPPP